MNKQLMIECLKTAECDGDIIANTGNNEVAFQAIAALHYFEDRDKAIEFFAEGGDVDADVSLSWEIARVIARVVVGDTDETSDKATMEQVLELLDMFKNEVLKSGR